jgi:hypothetical protein
MGAARRKTLVLGAILLNVGRENAKNKPGERRQNWRSQDFLSAADHSRYALFQIPVARD